MSTKPKLPKLPKIRLKDPFLEREQAKYGQPLPRREYMMELLEAQGVPVALDAFAELLAIQPDEMSFFARRIDAMSATASSCAIARARCASWISCI